MHYGEMDGEAGYDLERAAGAADRLVVITGCSGGGKSSLIGQLRRRGLLAYEEPGRQVVKEQLFTGGDALPWDNVDKFVALTVSRSIHNMVLAARSGYLAFFDRGFVDQISGLEHLGLPVPQYIRTAAERLRYCRTVFMVPPWPEIFHQDAERRHGLDEAVDSFGALVRTYERLDYELVEVPKATPEQRAGFILEKLGVAGH